MKICNNLMLEGLLKLSKIDEAIRWFEMNFHGKDASETEFDDF